MMKMINFHEKLEGYNNCILKDYKCCCSREWTDKNKLIIYYMDKENCKELLNIESNNIFDYLETVQSIVQKYLVQRKKLILAGGHTVINLKDRNFVSQEVINSVDFGMKLLSTIYSYFDKTDFLIPLNDFFMEKDEKNDDNEINFYRNEALNPYVLPESLRAIFLRESKSFKFDLYFCSEKNMADKFKRYIKNVKKNNLDIFRNYGKNFENWSYKILDKEIEVISNNKPNCVAGNASTFRDINFIIKNSKIKPNYDSHIAIYPLCSLENVINGYLVANDFYNLDLPTLLIFFDKKCF